MSRARSPPSGSGTRNWPPAGRCGSPSVGPAAQQRIRDLLKAALRDAVRSRLVIFNAAEHVPMEPSDSRKPEVWTAERTRPFWLDYEAVLKRSPITRGDRAFLVWRSRKLRPFR
jgi:hypothetical protein